MGLFGRAADVDPVAALRGSRVAAAHLLEGALTLKFTGRKGEVVVDAPGASRLERGNATVAHDAPGFASAVAELVGAKVQAVKVEYGRAVRLDLGAAGAISISLAQGEYPEPHALKVKGPGKRLASYHCDGCTKLEY